LVIGNIESDVRGGRRGHNEKLIASLWELGSSEAILHSLMDMFLLMELKWWIGGPNSSISNK